MAPSHCATKKGRVLTERKELQCSLFRALGKGNWSFRSTEKRGKKVRAHSILKKGKRFGKLSTTKGLKEGSSAVCTALEEKVTSFGTVNEGREGGKKSTSRGEERNAGEKPPLEGRGPPSRCTGTKPRKEKNERPPRPTVQKKKKAAAATNVCWRKKKKKSRFDLTGLEKKKAYPNEHTREKKKKTGRRRKEIDDEGERKKKRDGSSSSYP